ncbi:MAG: thioredoxin family protein [Bacteroidales bacterium]|nr:thioredoxin family protein [Bacteroidales bacterium]
MASSAIEILSSKNFSDYVSAQKELTIVQFHDEDNASCHIMDAVFKKIQEFYAGRVVCYTVRKPAASEIWEQFKIYQTPSYILMKENKTVEKISGLMSYDNFLSVVERCI